MKLTTLIGRITLLAACAATAMVLGWVLWACRHGFDFTDESLYLIWLHQPHDYPSSITQFGFVYHPLDWLLRGEIALLRQANVLLTFALAWGAGYLFIARGPCQVVALARKPRLGISAVFAGASLVFFQTWLPAPSYNSLALQALLVALIGLLLADRVRTRTSDAGWFCIALGGWLAFMAKPTTALALAVLCAVYLLCARKFSVRGVLIGLLGGGALLIAGAWLADGSIQQFIHRLQSGLVLGQELGGGHGFEQMLRIDPIVMPDVLVDTIWIAGAVAAGVTLFAASPWRPAQVAGALAVLASLAYAVGLVWGQVPARQFGMFQGMLLLAAPLAGVAVFAIRGLMGRWRIFQPERWALIAVCALLPFAYTFGTNNNYWVGSVGAAYFWVLAGAGLWGLTKPQGEAWANLLPMAVVALIATATLLQLAMATPYRQLEPLWDNDHPTTVGPDGRALLLLSQADGRYIEQFKHLGAQAGFVAGTPMIDLTGRSPGLLYAGGARNVGQPWLIGGYPGSSAFASMALDSVACDVLASSWLLLEPDSPRAIPLALLTRYGADVSQDYVVVGEVVRQTDAAHADDARRQQVLKPSRVGDTAVRACEAARRSRQPS